MRSFLRGSASASTLPLFPLKTVLFPGGVLPLKVFETRYIDMTKACLRDDEPFGVCLLLQGPEVLSGEAPQAQSFARIGTVARILQWDMPQLGILHLRTEGGARFQVDADTVGTDGLVTGEIRPIPAEPKLELPETCRSLAKLLEALIERVGRENFSSELAYDDASWVGYRLAELLPLPLTIKQTMLEVNDSRVRLEVIAQFLKQQGLV